MFVYGFSWNVMAHFLRLVITLWSCLSDLKTRRRIESYQRYKGMPEIGTAYTR